MAVRCAICGDRLTGAGGLEAHGHAHALPRGWQGGGAGFRCPSCGARFEGEEQLVRHEGRVHAREGGLPGGGARRAPGGTDHRPSHRRWPQG